MEAGRELDALIAEKVMGWKLLAVSGSEHGFIREGVALRKPIPRFSTDIAAAWQVVECMRERHDCGLIFKVFPVGFRFDYSAVFQARDNKQWSSNASTAPLAICLSALGEAGDEP